MSEDIGLNENRGEDRHGRLAVETIPELLIEAEKTEAELSDIKSALREHIRNEKAIPRGMFNGKSFDEKIMALSTKSSALRQEAQNRARAPMQTIFDM